MTNVNQAEFEGKVAIVTGERVESDARRPPFSARVVLQSSQKISNPESMNLLVIMNAFSAIVGDVSSEETAKRTVALAIERFGKVDILVNNGRDYHL